MVKKTLKIAIVSICGLLLSLSSVQASSPKKVEVIFTHDLHSHLDSYRVASPKGIEDVGGVSRLATVIKTQRQKHPDTLVVDAGDFSMGTLYQTLYERQATELNFLQELGFDATTLGNHEFDYGDKALAKMLTKAKKLPLLEANIDWQKSASPKLEAEFKKYGLKKYTVVKKGNVKIALIGVMGNDSIEDTPTTKLKFKDPVKSVKQTVAEIKRKEKVDMIVCLSHSGTSQTKTSEDEELAKKVPDLDLIISGHTHTVLNKPLRHGQTYIVSCGAYGRYTGLVKLKQKLNHRWKLVDYRLISMTQGIPKDQQVEKQLKADTALINQTYLSKLGYHKDQVIAYNPYNFESVDDHYFKPGEHRLGDFMADSYLYALQQAKVKADVAIVPAGVIRDTLVKGPVTINDAFNLFSLGKGQDKLPVYPLVRVYLTGKDLKKVAEIDASLANYLNSARLYMSGLGYEYNPHRALMNKVTAAYLLDKQGHKKQIKDTKLYPVVADMYSAHMLGSLKKQSYGLLNVTPRKSNGQAVTDYQQMVVMKGQREYKVFEAFASYLQSFPKGRQGLATIPSYYNQLHKRKVQKASYNPLALLSKPNRFTFALIGIVLVLVLIIIWVAKKLLRLKRAKFKRK